MTASDGSLVNLTTLYPDRYRVLALAAMRGESAPPVVVACPGCGLSYFVDRPAGDERVDHLEWHEAHAKLDGECHDHPHSFRVGPYVPSARPT